MNQEEQAILTPRPFTPMFSHMQHNIVMRMPNRSHRSAWFINIQAQITTSYERN